MGDKKMRVIFFGHKFSGKTTTLKKIVQTNLNKTAHQKVEEVTTGGTVGDCGVCKYETQTTSYEIFEAPSNYDHVCGMMKKAKEANIAVLFISALDGDTGLYKTESIVFTHLILTLGMKKILVVVNETDAIKWTQQRFRELVKCLSNIVTQYDVGNQFDFKCTRGSFETDKGITNFFSRLDEFEVFAHDGTTTRQSGGDEAASFVQKWAAVDLLLDTEPTNVNHWKDRVEIFLNAAKSGFIQYADWFEAATKANKFGSVAKLRYENEAFTLVNEGHKERAGKNIQNAKTCYDRALKIFKKHKMNYAFSYLNVISIGLERELKKISQESKEEIYVVEPEKAEEKEKTESKKKKRNRKKGAASDQPQVVEQEKYEEEKDAVSGSDQPQVVEQEKYEEEKDAVSGSDQPQVVEQEKYEEEKDAVSGSDQPQVVEQEKYEEEKDAVEQEKYEEEKDAVSANEDEKKAVKSLHIASSATYEITVLSHSHCQGMKILSNGISLPQSFVACTDIQLEKLAEVVSMGFSNSSILTVSDIVQIPIDGETKSFFVAEPVKPLDVYFQLKYENWCITGAEGRVTDLTKWWSLIEDKFHLIYRDVIDTVFYLHSKGFSCGDLFAVQDTIYITSDENPRILPSMKSEATSAKDVKDLVRNMKGIINLPYAGERLLLDGLPCDLSHLFTWFMDGATKNVPFWFLLDHYFFWTPQERIDFIKRTRKFINSHFLRHLENAMEGEPIFGTVIPKDGIFYAIWKKGDPLLSDNLQDGEKKEAGYFKVFPYIDQSDILRYMVAVYNHHNDVEYASLRTQKLDDVKIEVELRKLFPKIYGNVLSALSNGFLLGNINEEDLVKLSRHRHK